jgi:hypothetical protein
MDAEITTLRKQIIEKVLARQDEAFRWGYEERQERERPETLYYSPNFRSTLWTLVLLADIRAPADLERVKPALRLITERFYNPEHGIFTLPDLCRFPIPCLNGNMIHLHSYFKTDQTETLNKVIDFFAENQRFDDGDFKTPQTMPYCSNKYCYGRHTCYWGVVKLLKGITFIPKTQRTKAAQRLVGNNIEFILHHEVCYSSHHKEEFLHRDIGRLTFPNFYKSDVLEILWLLAREDVHDGRMSCALELLRSKMKDNGTWDLERAANTVVPTGQIGCGNAFLTERAIDVLHYYEQYS